MIKQLQLRGISRTPSDRATTDGGCAESLNVQLDENEIAPAPIPQDVSEDIYGTNLETPANIYPIHYIHKLPSGAEIYVGYSETSENVWTLKAYKDKTMLSMTTVTSEPKEFVSIGNTLIVYTADKPHYFLFKDGEYKSLGTEIPRPAIEIVTRNASPVSEYYYDIEVPDGALRDTNSSTDEWDAARDEADENHADLLGAMKNIWDEVSLRLDALRLNGKFVAPFFLRYALRLYDGSYIYSSVPILCGARGNIPSGTTASLDWLRAFRYVESSKNKLGIDFNDIFTVWVLGAYNVGDWKDIAKSIDFFASTPVYAPNFNAAYQEMSYTTIAHGTKDGYDITFENMEEGEKDKTVKDEVLSKVNFYKIKSIDLNSTEDMLKLSSGEMVIENSRKVSGDELLVQEKMPYAYRDSSQYIPANGTMNFNNHLLLMGGNELLSGGEQFLNGQAISIDGEPLYKFKMRFRISDSASGATNYVMGRYYNGGTLFTPAGYSTISERIYHGNSDTLDMAQPFSWLCFPDSRCTAVEISYYDGDVYVRTREIPLEKHPSLECSYAFIGFGKAWFDTSDTTAYPQYDTVSFSETENRYLPQPNKIFLSEFENPFNFSAGGIITMPDEVVGAAVTSVPLSEGQFGQFPLYVFTKGGIRVLATNSEGTFSSNVAQPNLARHVAYPGTILGIEQAVIFTTDRGVMMLSGGDVQCISENMNGRHRKLDAEVVSLIEEWEGYSDLIEGAVTDNNTFMEYMKSANVAYDYNGARLIFTKQAEVYHYVYTLRTGTWHKMINPLYDEDVSVTNTILNSYPECYMARTSVQATTTTIQGVATTVIPPQVYDYSTILDDADLISDTASPRYSIIATRSFDLGEPDVRKAIKSIRIRGAYNRGDVKYVLLGSFDGINWKLLYSLRGGSYKMFRLVILSKLSPTERISWVDIDYDSRFMTKLR